MEGDVSRMQTAWDYQYTLLSAYNLLANSCIEYGDVLNSNKIHPVLKQNYKRKFTSRLYTFYVMCSHKFGEYIGEADTLEEFKPKIDKDAKLNKADYDKLLFSDYNSEKIIMMFQILSDWAQKDGPFRTIKVTGTPSNAFRNGFRQA